MKLSSPLIAVCLLLPALSASAFEVRRDARYSAIETHLIEHDAAGVEVSRLAMPTTADPRGIAVGPRDGLFYVVTSPFNSTLPPRVDIRGTNGAVLRSQAIPGGFTWSNVSWGKIAFDPSGTVFYVGHANGVHRFTIDGNEGALWFATAAYDVDVLPNGEVLVATVDAIKRFSPDGTELATFTAIDDPTQILGPTPRNLFQVRGVAYVPSIDATVVCVIGLGTFDDVLLFDGTGNRLLDRASWFQCDDIHTTPTQIFIGSSAAPPAIFDFELTLTGIFQGPGMTLGANARFVTSFGVTYIFGSGFEDPQ